MQTIDFEKFSQYSKPGPRYTSYPTAVEFNENFNEESLKTAFFNHDNLKNPMPLSLYTHLPFCRSACYFWRLFSHLHQLRREKNPLYQLP